MVRWDDRPLVLLPPPPVVFESRPDSSFVVPFFRRDERDSFLPSPVIVFVFVSVSISNARTVADFTRDLLVVVDGRFEEGDTTETIGDQRAFALSKKAAGAPCWNPLLVAKDPFHVNEGGERV